MFSKSCQYAFQSVIYIALHSQSGACVGLKVIADHQEIPNHFLSKILQILVRNNILISTKGPNGGFVLKKSSNNIRLIEVVEIIDGHGIFDRCGIGLKECSDTNPCPIHFDYKQIKEKIKQLLSEKTLGDLIKDIEMGKSIVSYR